MGKIIGVIGLGSIGSRHARNLRELGHDVLGYDAAMAGEMFDLKEVDGVVIATPSARHVADILTAQQYCRMPIFVEKPIGASEDDLLSLGEVYAAGDKVDMVGNNLRFHSVVKEAKKLLMDGVIGDSIASDFMVGQKNDKYTDPVILNWGAHEIDLAHYLLGSGTVVNAIGNDRIAQVTMLQEGGVITHIHMDYICEPRSRGFVIIGSKGRLVGGLDKRYIHVEKPSGTVMNQAFHDSYDSDYKDEMKAFIDLIDGKSTPGAATGRDGLITLETILEAQRQMVRV